MLQCAHCPATAPETQSAGWIYASVTLDPVDGSTPPEDVTTETLCPACAKQARRIAKGSENEAHD